MCGIVGIVRAPGSPLPDLGPALEALRHRGPDAQRVVDIDGVAAFGHTRLSIIDVEVRSHQPMADASGRYTLTYNGEVYNYRALRAELEALGHRFRTESDTEVVAESFARWHTDAFAKFDGMFALAIWDREERELVLARDRFGEKPLCYVDESRWFAFASELSALRAARLVREAPISVAALNQYLAVGYTLAPLSAHPDVKKVEPASFLRVRPGRGCVTTRYWDYAAAFRHDATGSQRDMVQRVDELVSDAVRSRLVSDVPVGSFLSGGLDSSLVTACVKESLPYELHTFSVGFEPANYDESSDARLVANVLGTVHHETVISVAEGAALAEAALTKYDEPFSDTSLVPMVHVARLASKHVKVVLSGDAADELFGGYVTYHADRIMALVARMPPRARRAIAKEILARTSDTAAAKTSLAFRLRQLARGLPLSPAQAHACWRELHSVEERIRLIGAKHAEEIRDTCPSRVFARHYAEVMDLPLLSQHLYVDAKTWLANAILVKVDRATMASSIESRAPFLARALVEYVASLPADLKIHFMETKVALRRVGERRLPARTLRKPKSGFSAPVALWYNWSGENEYRLFNRHVAERRGINLHSLNTAENAVGQRVEA